MSTPKIKYVLDTIPNTSQEAVDKMTTLASTINQLLSIADQTDVVIAEDSVMVVGPIDAVTLYKGIGDSMTD